MFDKICIEFRKELRIKKKEKKTMVDFRNKSALLLSVEVNEFPPK
jgi:hypothetical protein